MSDLTRVQTGQKLAIPAQTWNTVLDATEDYMRRRQNIGVPVGVASAASSTIVLVKNSSGVDVARMNILGISTPAITPTQNPDQFASRVILNGVLPSLQYHAGKFAVTLEPIAAGAIGLACIGGICPVNLSVTSAGDLFADVSGSVANLKTGSSGAEIVWKESGTGNKLGLVRIGPAIPSPIQFAKLSAPYAGDEYAEANPCRYDGENPVTTTTLYLLARRVGNPKGITANAGTVVMYLPFVGDEVIMYWSHGILLGIVGGGMPDGDTHNQLLRYDGPTQNWALLNPGNDFEVLYKEDTTLKWGEVRAT